jgi:hypothetical protein
VTGPSNQILTVGGKDFQPGLTVNLRQPGGGSNTLSGAQILGVTSTSARISATVNGIGIWTVSVRNPSGQSSNAWQFAVAGVSPATVFNPPVSPSAPRQSAAPQTPRVTLDQITPSAIAASAVSQLLRVSGRGFRATMALTVTSPVGQVRTYGGAQLLNVTSDTFGVLVPLSVSGTWTLRATAGGESSNVLSFSVRGAGELLGRQNLPGVVAPGWKVIKDRTGQCQASAPADWIVDTAGHAGNASGAGFRSVAVVAGVGESPRRAMTLDQLRELGAETVFENTPDRTFFAGPSASATGAVPSQTKYVLKVAGSPTCTIEVSIPNGQDDAIARRIATSLTAVRR